MPARTNPTWRGATVTVWLLCGAAALGASEPPRQGTGQGATAAVRGRERTFDPARQKAMKIEKGDVEVAFLEAQACKRCKTAYQLSFETTDRAHGITRRFTISDGPSQVDAIQILGNRKAAIIGQYQSSVDMVVLVDLGSGAVLDKWLCFDPSVSPDGDLIAYRKVYPVHFTDGVSSVYLVYQTGRSPAENRAAGIPLTDTTNVGTPVYPDGATNVPGDNTHLDEGVRHQLASDGFFWTGSRKLAFADRSARLNSIVVADLAAGIDLPQITVTSLDTNQILSRDGCREFRDQGREHEAMLVSNIEFLDSAANQLRLHFNYSLPDCRGPATVDLTVR